MGPYEYRVEDAVPEEIDGHAVVGWGSADGWWYPRFGHWLVNGHTYCWDATCRGDDVNVYGQEVEGAVRFFRFCEACASEQERGVPGEGRECPCCGVVRGPHATGVWPLRWPEWGPQAAARAKAR